MRKLSILSVLLVCLFVFSGAANATGLRTEFNHFEISPVNNLYVGKNVQGIWKLSYSNNEIPVTILKRKTIEGAEYIVRSEFFEVSYACSAKGFGVKMVRKSWQNVPRKINKAVLNEGEMCRQQILTPNKPNDKKALGLIASYLPDLLNDGYTHLLN